jgi:hypothetical protein
MYILLNLTFCSHLSPHAFNPHPHPIPNTQTIAAIPMMQPNLKLNKMYKSTGRIFEKKAATKDIADLTCPQLSTTSSEHELKLPCNN